MVEFSSNTDHSNGILDRSARVEAFEGRVISVETFAAEGEIDGLGHGTQGSGTTCSVSCSINK